MQESMRIVAILYRESKQFLRQCSKAGLSARMARGAVIVDLPRCGYRFMVPAQLKHLKLVLEATEYGGAKTKTGSGTIVCAPDGNALKPYRVLRTGHIACKTHAHFSVGQACVTLTGYRNSEQVMIQECSIVHEAGMVGINVEVLWEGGKDDLPEQLRHYSLAVEAAVEKANCYHCRHVHYSVEGVR